MIYSSVWAPNPLRLFHLCKQCFFFCRGSYKRMCKNVNWEKVLANRLPLEGIDQSHLFYSLSGEARVKYSPFRDLLYHCEDSYLLPQKAEIRLAACITFASWQMLCCLLFRLKKNSNVSTLILNPLILVLCLVGLGWVFLLFWETRKKQNPVQECWKSRWDKWRILLG